MQPGFAGQIDALMREFLTHPICGRGHTGRV
jgi:hypothetical protein